MRDYINSFLHEFEFSETERLTLALAYEKILSNGTSRALLGRIVGAYERDVASISDETLGEISALSDASGVHLYTAELVVLICLTRKLRERLAAIGVPKKNVTQTLADLVCKMHECELIYGVVGVFTWDWFVRILQLRTIAFGRLQFQLSEFKGQNYYRKHGKIIKKHAPVLAVHIPSGAPLSERACLSAYKEAHAFFTRALGVDDIPFTCSSWLLYPLNRGILPENSNIVKFMNQYDIIEAHDYDEEHKYAAFPYVFLRMTETPIAELPRDTALRAGYAAHLENGGSMGYGYGVRFLQNENDTD